MTDHSELRQRLFAKRQEFQQRLASTQATERREVEEGLNDAAQLWEVSEIRDGLDDEAAEELHQVDQALARLDAGGYGICESCGKPIGVKRLEALPFATLCIDCAEGAE